MAVVKTLNSRTAARAYHRRRWRAATVSLFAPHAVRKTADGMSVFGQFATPLDAARRYAVACRLSSRILIARPGLRHGFARSTPGA